MKQLMYPAEIGYRLRLTNGSVGVVSDATHRLILESTGEGALHLICPNANAFRISWGNPTGTDRMNIRWNETNLRYELGFAGGYRLWHYANIFEFQEAVTIRTIAGTNLTLNALTTGAVIIQSGGTTKFTANNTGIGFYTATAVAQAAAITNAPAGGTGAAAGAWDTAANRDSAITSINNILTALRNLGLIAP